jgi:hypothetical protein
MPGGHEILLAMNEPESEDWTTEEVKPSQLRIADVVKHGGSWPWATIIEIHEIPESSPEWERKLGTLLFVCEPVSPGGGNRRLIAYDGHDQHLVTRRRV